MIKKLMAFFKKKKAKSPQQWSKGSSSKSTSPAMSMSEIAKLSAESHSKAVNELIETRLQQALKPYEGLVERVTTLEEGTTINLEELKAKLSRM